MRTLSLIKTLQKLIKERCMRLKGVCIWKISAFGSYALKILIKITRHSILHYFWSAEKQKAFLNWLCQYLFFSIIFNRFCLVEKYGITVHWLYRRSLILGALHTLFSVYLHSLIRLSGLFRRSMYIMLYIFWKTENCRFQNSQNSIEKCKWARTKVIRKWKIGSLWKSYSLPIIDTFCKL